MQDVQRLTGLELSEVIRQPETQLLTRIGRNGAREELVRIPVELLIEEPEN